MVLRPTIRHAAKIDVKFKITNDGGFVSDTVEITAAIPLDRLEPGYDQTRADELKTDAVKYAGQRGIPTIVFVEGR